MLNYQRVTPMNSREIGGDGMMGLIDTAVRLIFDYPTISSVASYASEQLGAGAATMPMAMPGVAGAGGVGTWRISLCTLW